MRNSRGLLGLGALVLFVLLAAPTRAIAQSETTEYYGTDAVGSVRIVFSASGAVLGRQDYDPFGREILSAWGVPPERFGGQTADGEVQQAYFHARQFQSRTGRFGATDPVFDALADPQRFNRYSYALNNPISLTDASGLNAAACTTSWVGGDDGHWDISCPNGPTQPWDGGGGWDVGLWFFFNGPGPIIDTGNEDDDGGGGGGQSQTQSPLPVAENNAIQNAVSSLANTSVSEKCESSVAMKLGYTSTDVQDYLQAGVDIFDGTRSTVPAATSLYPPQAAAAFTAENPKVTTMASLFSQQPGIMATTSLVTNNLTIYVRPSAISKSHHGVNARNKSLILHEALHGLTGLGDDDLMKTFRLKPPSVSITRYIRKKCK
jgi:RHS repeat-associated protein